MHLPGTWRRKAAKLIKLLIYYAYSICIGIGMTRFPPISNPLIVSRDKTLQAFWGTAPVNFLYSGYQISYPTGGGTKFIFT